VSPLHSKINSKRTSASWAGWIKYSTCSQGFASARVCTRSGGKNNHSEHFSK